MTWARPAICIATLGSLAPAQAPALADPATAPAGREPSYSELVEEVRALRAEMSQIRARERNYVSAAEVDATVKRVMEDAERRSRFVDLDGGTAGWDGKRFTIRSADKRFSISPAMNLQARHVAAYREEIPGNSESDPAVDDGFEFRRIRLGVQGNFFSENLTYRLIFAIDQGREAVTRDAYIQYRFAPDWAVQVGQYKDPWTQEENVSDTRQLAVERSLLNSLIGGANTARVEGVNLIYGQGKPWRAFAGIHDGAASSDTPFENQRTDEQSPLLGGGEATFGTTGRVEYFAYGTPDQYEDYSARENKEDLLVFGAGAYLTQAGDNDAVFHGVDVQWENARGVGLFAEYVGLFRQIGSGSRGERGVAVGEFYDYGLLAQVGYMVAPKWEIFTRYGYIRLDDSSFTDEREARQDEIHEITSGVNYFIFGHNAKFTIDLTYLPNGSPDAPRLGYLSTEQNGVVLRTQLQLSF